MGVGLAGIEPATSALSVLRSNRLSYSPVWKPLLLVEMVIVGRMEPRQGQTESGPPPTDRRYERDAVLHPACEAASARSSEVSGETTEERDAFNRAMGSVHSGQTAHTRT